MTYKWRMDGKKSKKKVAFEPLKTTEKFSSTELSTESITDFFCLKN